MDTPRQRRYNVKPLDRSSLRHLLLESACKKLMGKRLAFPKHHKAYQVATLFGTLVYLRNDVSHNRWLIRKTFKAPIPSFTKEGDSNRTALSDYFQWIEHLLSLLSLEASHAFFLRLNELKMTAPRAIQEHYF